MTKLLIVTAPFYPDITSELKKGTLLACDKHGVEHDEISVPGAFEIPAAIRYAIAKNAYDGFVALGCIIRGETTHYDIICDHSARGLMDLMLQHNAAIGNGILTVENKEQAMARARVDRGNKGLAAAEACLHLIAIQSGFNAA